MVGWVIGQLDRAGITSQRTAGNDPKGDILIVELQDASRVKEIVLNIHDRFNRKNPRHSQSNLKEIQTNLPHIEIKTTYIYGKEVNEIIDTATVIAVVSAGRISEPGKAKFSQAGIAYAENIPLNEFINA